MTFGNETAAAVGEAELEAAARGVVVSRHAMIRARDRRHFAELSASALEARIASEVRGAIAAGRMSTSKPALALLMSARELRGMKPKPVPVAPGYHFVWDEGERHGWIIRRTHGVTTVVTSLHRVRAEREDAAA